MNEIRIFKNPSFGEVRTIEEDGRVLFCGPDVAKALGYAKPRNALAAHCKGALKRGVLTAGGVQDVTFVPEGDVYRLITHSKLPAAEEFEKWVFDEVLPSIRRTGAYLTPEVASSLQVSLSAMTEHFTAQQEKLDRLERYIIKVGRSQNYTNYFLLREFGSKKASAWKRGVTEKLKVLEESIGMPSKEILHYIYEYMKKQLGVNLDMNIDLYKKVNGIKTCSALDVVDDSKSLRQSFDESMSALFGAVNVPVPELTAVDDCSNGYSELLSKAGLDLQ